METLIGLLADGLVVPAVALAGYALLFRIPKEGRFEAYCRILMAGLTAYFLAKIAGSLYQPEGGRPFELMGVDPGASYLNNPGFPSDHALFMAFLAVAVWFETRNKLLVVILATLTLLVALGRVLALVHSPLDVIGGIILSMGGIVWFMPGLYESVKARKKPS